MINSALIVDSSRLNSFVTVDLRAQLHFGTHTLAAQRERWQIWVCRALRWEMVIAKANTKRQFSHAHQWNRLSLFLCAFSTRARFPPQFSSRSITCAITRFMNQFAPAHQSKNEKKQHFIRSVPAQIVSIMSFSRRVSMETNEAHRRHTASS